MDLGGAAAARDRWEWRRRLRRAPVRYRVYRVVVAVVGVALVLVGLALGPFPGPGGVPLVLAGLATLASEFAWARRLLDRAKQHLLGWSRWARRQPGWLRATGSAALLAVVVGAAWAGLAVVGTPAWLPGSVEAALLHLPGVEARAVR